MITVLGLWHLGSVTAACCAEHFPTVGLDFDAQRIDSLGNGKAPLMEPGLDELIAQGLARGSLGFTSDPVAATRDTRLLWVTLDTPVGADDRADVGVVLDAVRAVVPHLKPGTVVLISSQLPVNSTRLLEDEFAELGLKFAYSPENLRLGKALEVFRDPDRIVVGTRDEATRDILQPVLAKFSDNILWMGTESAEMTKHAINAFLAMSVAFANELARLCEKTGANAHEVAAGLKSESRIGPGAYVSPGTAFAGGTLARDVQFLTQLGQARQEELQVIPAIMASNEAHKSWAYSRLVEALQSLKGKTIGILGLTYKPGTSTLRRSSAMELARQLQAAGALVIALDPAVEAADPDLEGITLCASAQALFGAADAVVLMTPWPEFREFDWRTLVAGMKQPVILDPTRFCAEALAGVATRYYSVGVPA